MRRKAFTITEIMISILILTIMAAAMTLSPNASKHTAKREAERVSAKINRLIESSVRTHAAFWIDVKDNRLEIITGKTYSNPSKKEDFKATAGCSYSFDGKPQEHIHYDSPVSVDITEDYVKDKYNIKVKSSETKTECYLVLYGN